LARTDPRALYNTSASSWVRTAPKLLSDFSARPRVIEVCGDFTNLRILDLGCGEGYVARMLLEGGASEVVGIDLSTEMIAAANVSTNDSRAQYLVWDLRSGLPELNGQFDLVIAVFLFNYMTDAEVSHVMMQLAPILRRGGRVIITIPHPALPHLRRSVASRAVFDFCADHPYLSSLDTTMLGHILDVEGLQVDVLAVSRTVESFLKAVNLNLWRLDQLLELGLPDDPVPECFEPLRGEPLHMLFAFTPLVK